MSGETPAADKNKGVHPFARHFLFLDSPRFRSAMFWVLGVLTLGLGLVDLAIHRHTYFAIEKTPAFYALFGFAAFTFVVLVGGYVLRGLLSRPETYYDQDESDV